MQKNRYKNIKNKQLIFMVVFLEPFIGNFTKKISSSQFDGVINRLFF